MYHGDIRLGATIDIKFFSGDLGATVGATAASIGIGTALLGTPAIAAYPGNSTTEITAGITLTASFDSRTALNHVRVEATSGNGYATGTDYALVLTAGTVDGISVVGMVVGSFSIENRSAVMPTTAGRTLDVSAGGEAGVDWANVGSPTTTLNLSGTTVKTATDVETDTADIQGRLPAALVSGRIDASVGAMAANTMTASALAADAVTEIQSGLSTLTAAQVNTEVLDCLVTDTHAELAAVPAATSSLKDKINWLFLLARNKLTQSATTQAVRNDGDSSNVATAAVSDSGTEATRAEWS